MSRDGKKRTGKHKDRRTTSPGAPERLERQLFYMPACRKALLTFPEVIKDGMAFALRSLTRNPSEALGATLASHGYPGFDTKSLKSIRAKIAEIRKQDAQHWYRLAYTTEFPNYLFALHAFLKKTNDTSKEDRNVILQRAKTAASLYRERVRH